MTLHLRHINKGFSLVELLISMVIFALSALGLASLQAVSYKDSHDAYMYSLAAMYTYDMGDRIRSNPGHWDNITDTYQTDEDDSRTFYHCSADDDYTVEVLTSISTPALCTYSELAEYDLYRWGQDISSEFPDSTWIIKAIPDPDDAAKQLINITIQWSTTNHSAAEYFNTPSYSLTIRPDIF